MARRRRVFQPGLWIQTGPDSGLTSQEQEALWRAAAKGYAADGKAADSQAALLQAQMIRRTREMRFAPRTDGRSDQSGIA